MKGGIYTQEKCPVCGTTMKDGGRAVACPVHTKQKATSFFVRFEGIFKRFKSYDEAARFLNGIRFKTDEGSFDSRDYQRDNPLGFRNLSDKYQDIKSATLKPDSCRAIKSHMRRAEAFFRDRNVKEIHYGDLEDFFLAQKDISTKTVKNIRTTLHNFFSWLVKRRIIRREQMPEFPEWSYELGFRKTIDKNTQGSIIDEIERLTGPANRRALIAIRWLATYVNLRPGDLTEILEEDIDLVAGVIMIRQHKTSKTTHKIKVIPLIAEDLDELRALPRGFPSMPFFRWEKGGHGRTQGQPFGRNYLYKLWIKACTNLGVEGVDLYGGTRHSSAQALRSHLSPEGIRRLTGHETNKAFERYYQVSLDELRDGFQMIRDPSQMDAKKAKKDK